MFYAAECMLKAYYLRKFSLKNTADRNSLAEPARSYVHALDRLLIALQVPPADCRSRPDVLRLRDGRALAVSQLHEAWRYSEKIDDHPNVLQWLASVLIYAEARI